MLAAYGVLIGDFISAGEQQSPWLQATLNLNVNGTPWQCSVDVNDANGGFQYRIFDKMSASLFQIISTLADGYHPLACSPHSGAMDYARNPILTTKLGCLAILITLLNTLFKTKDHEWKIAIGNEAADALINMLQASRKVYVFGAPTPEGQAMHDIHCNQGAPAHSQWARENGAWQDGCIFVQKQDGSFSAYLAMFASQTLRTDNQGKPV